MTFTASRPLFLATVRQRGGLLLVVFLVVWAVAGGEKKKPEQPVNLNTAPVAELVQLPGVGEVMARRIVRHRERSGKFRTVEELLVIRGISRKKLEALRPYVTVETERPKEANKKD